MNWEQEQKLKLRAFEIERQQELKLGAERRRATLERKRLDVAAAVLHGKLIVLDVETQYLSTEVDEEWGAVSEFLVAVAVTWDKANESRIWYEKDVPDLLVELTKFAQILTFNGERFDFKVLEHYGSINELKKRSVDLLGFIEKHTQKWVSLDSLAKECPRVGETMTGIEAVNLWRSGDPEKQRLVVDYCKRDVEILRDLYVELHAVGLRFTGRNFRTFRIWADGSHGNI